MFRTQIHAEQADVGLNYKKTIVNLLVHLCPLKYGHIKSAVDPAIDENSNPVCLVA